MLQDNLIIAGLSFLSAFLAIAFLIVSASNRHNRRDLKAVTEENTKLVYKMIELQKTANENAEKFNQMKETNKKNCETIRKNTELAKRKIRLQGWLGFGLAALIH